MFNLNAFASNQNPSLRNTPTKHLQNVSQAFFPMNQPNQPNWDNPAYLFDNKQELKNREDIPYNIRVLLDNEQERSFTSSNSEETDTMPEVNPRTKNNTKGAREWDFGQGELGRRKSEIVSPSDSLLQNIVNPSALDQAKSKNWTPSLLPGKVHVKSSFFSPLNAAEFTHNEKKAYFVTIEGFNPTNSSRFFKIERLCHELQGGSLNAGNLKSFLYISLWNQNDDDNIFEPWIYAISQLNFRLVLKIHMSHAYEDPFVFDFSIDLRQFALPTKDKRTQSLEINFIEQGKATSPGGTSHPSNNITLHVQVTNEKLLVPHGFRNVQDSPQFQNSDSFDYTVILRQIMIGLPLLRAGNVAPLKSPLIPHHNNRIHDVYAKRGSAISLGQETQTRSGDPQSPMSWDNFSRDESPANTKFPSPKQHQADPLVPPGMIATTGKVTGGGQNDGQNFRTSGSIFQMQNRQQLQRSNTQQQPGRRDSEEGGVYSKRGSIIGDPTVGTTISTIESEKGSSKIIDPYTQTFRKESTASESTSGTNFSFAGRFQPNNGGNNNNNNSSNVNESDSQNQSFGTTQVSSYVDVPEATHQSEDGSQFQAPIQQVQIKTESGDEFKIDEYVGKMVDYAKTYQGSKILQKFIVSAAVKDDLDVVVREIGEKIGELMLDPYANYMIQTLVQNGTPRQRLYLLQKIAPSFTSIARDKKGTHSLQSIVAQIDSQDEFALMKNIVGPYVFELSMDPRANYVIQKLINIIPPDSSNFLYQPLFDNFVQVANNSFGLLVLKQMMARVEQKEILKHRVVEFTCMNFEKLIQNPYGNYAIQHIVEYYPKDSSMIMNKILSKFIPYSSQKISSNVIEKCLTVCEPNFRKRVVDEILKNGRLGDLLKNKYGNFVTLQLLAAAGQVDKQKLMQEIFRCANSFNGTKYKTRWLKFIEENPMKINWNGSASSDAENQFGDSEAAGEGISKKVEEEKLEAVKKIWRDMTKEEKNETSPFHYSNNNNNSSNFNNNNNAKGPSTKKYYQK